MNKKLGASLKACCTGSVRHDESVTGSVTHSITRLKTIGGSFIACIVAATLAGNLYAEPPDLKDDKGMPRYLEEEFAIINEKLDLNAEKLDRNAELMGDLSDQLVEAEKNLKLEIGSAKQEILARVAALASDVAAVEDLLLEPEKDIQLTTEVCFDLAASWDWALSTKFTGGVGWEGGVKVDAVAELSMPGPLIIPAPIPPMWFTSIPVIPAVSSGVGSTLCVTVPLYSVASNTYWTDRFDTEDFDNLIAGVAAPSQALLPTLAHAFGTVMPDPEPVADFLGDGVNLVFPPKGMSTKQAITNASESFDAMVKSTVLHNVMESADFSDPCGLVGSLTNTDPNSLETIACRVAFELTLDILDPFCLMDWAVPHCP